MHSDISVYDVPTGNYSIPHIIPQKCGDRKESVALILQFRCGLIGCAEEKNRKAVPVSARDDTLTSLLIEDHLL